MRKIVKNIFIKASPDVVWPYLTDKDKIGTWFHAPVQSFAVNEDYRMHLKNTEIWGKVLDMDAPNRLVWSFNHNFLNHDTTVTITLEAQDNGTALTLVHEGFEGSAGDVAKLFDDHNDGWDEHLAKLAAI